MTQLLNFMKQLLLPRGVSCNLYIYIAIILISANTVRGASIASRLPFIVISIICIIIKVLDCWNASSAKLENSPFLNHSRYKCVNILLSAGDKSAKWAPLSIFVLLIGRSSFYAAITAADESCITVGIVV